MRRRDLHNGTNLIATLASAPYNFRALGLIMPQGVLYVLTAKPPIATASRHHHPQMRITNAVTWLHRHRRVTDLNGAQHHGRQCLYWRQHQAANSAVTINGQLFISRRTDEFFINHLQICDAAPLVRDVFVINTQPSADPPPPNTTGPPIFAVTVGAAR
jgi:hypothetical protein